MMRYNGEYVSVFECCWLTKEKFKKSFYLKKEKKNLNILLIKDADNNL